MIIECDKQIFIYNNDDNVIRYTIRYTIKRVSDVPNWMSKFFRPSTYVYHDNTILNTALLNER